MGHCNAPKTPTRSIDTGKWDHYLGVGSLELTDVNDDMDDDDYDNKEGDLDEDGLDL